MTFHVIEVRISMYEGRPEVIQAIKFLKGRTTVFWNPELLTFKPISCKLTHSGLNRSGLQPLISRWSHEDLTQQDTGGICLQINSILLTRRNIFFLAPCKRPWNPLCMVISCVHTLHFANLATDNLHKTLKKCSTSCFFFQFPELNLKVAEDRNVLFGAIIFSRWNMVASLKISSTNYKLETIQNFYRYFV